MKTTLLITNALLMGVIALSGCASGRSGAIRVGDTPARKIAKDRSIPGKGVDGQCLEFAYALHRKFEQAGIHSKVITYQYNALAWPAYATQATSGAHAVVAYDDGGRTYIMDNQSWLPTWVQDASAAGLQQFSGLNLQVNSSSIAAVR